MKFDQTDIQRDELIKEVIKYAKMSVKDVKIYRGLSEALEKLEKISNDHSTRTI